MKTKKTIVWITVFPHPIYGTMIGAIAKRFPDLSLRAIVAKRFESIPWGQANVQWISLDSWHFGKIAGMVYMRGLEKKLAEMHPSMIICNLYASLFCLQAYRFAKKKNIPLIVTTEEKDSEDFMKKIWFPLWNLLCGKSILEYSSCILAWSKDSKRFMQCATQEKGKVICFPAGVDTSLLVRDKGKIYSPGGIMRLLVVASMVPCKDHFTLLRAIQHLRGEGFGNFKLDLVGDGPLRGKVETMIQEQALQGEVRIVAPVPHIQMNALYQSYDVLILPSKKEAVGMVVLEAMACGLPVIVSDGAGAREYVQESVNGFIFPAGNYKELAGKIIAISKMNLDRMGTNARKHMVENFDIHDLARKLDGTLSVWENHKI